MSESALLATSTDDRPLLQAFDKLRQQVPFAPLAELPTPVTELTALQSALGASGVPVFEKRDDLSSPMYGGNKVRTLEVLLGNACALGVRRVYATGAYGSNHAAATAMHAPRLGLESGAIVYPQPPSLSAAANFTLIRDRATDVVDLPHWSLLPWGMWRTARRCRREGVPAQIMLPGGATPTGALGYVSAGLELAQQVARGELPAPETIVVATGSNCTTAGLLVGVALATRLGIGFRQERPPVVVGVRVTPWPVTSPRRIVGLARRTARLLEHLTGSADCRFDRKSLARCFRLETRFYGSGYGMTTPEAEEACSLWERHTGHELETTYSGKSAAALVRRIRDGGQEKGPLLFWSTKSSAPLPDVKRLPGKTDTRRSTRFLRRSQSASR